MGELNKQRQDFSRVLRWYMSFTGIGGLSQIHATDLKVISLNEYRASPIIMTLDNITFAEYDRFLDILYYDKWLI